MPWPRLLLVRQSFPDRAIRDIPAEVYRELNQAPFASRLAPGAPVAIGVGSRGISNLAAIVRAVVSFWKSKGMRPFIFPAMGSHGAATAEGQAEVLAHYGIVEETVGCPVISQLEVVSLGKTPEGIEAYLDKAAYDAGAVMMVGRVKWHTDFTGKLESGLFKMMAIGLGKFAGAQQYHTFAYKLGLEHVIRSVGRLVLASGKILGGLAIVEDARHDTALLAAVPAEVMETREEELLETAKSWMGRVPMDLDILMLDEIGKNISGAGMDTKVVNRATHGQYNPWPGPKFERIYVRGLSPLSYGNGIGIGLADVVHDRLLEQIDWIPTQINSLTAGSLASIRTPIHFPTDKMCLEKIFPTVGKFAAEEVTLGWIRNSLELGLLALTENLRPAIEANPALRILRGPEEFPFDREGNLPMLWDWAGECAAAEQEAAASRH